MIAVPAVDLKGGRCVQLVGGRPEHEAVSLPDAVAVAADWSGKGYQMLHIVDLDAALGSGDNMDLITRVLAASDATTQVGGGIRDDARADALLGAGVDRIIVGTRAVADRPWLEALADRHPGRVVVAVDSRDGQILLKGWQEGSGIDLLDFLPGLAALPLAGVLSTDVGREGRMEGIDTAAVQASVEISPHPVWVSGGVTTLEELQYLEDIEAAGAVLGMALYTNTLNARTVAERWGRIVLDEEDR